MLVPFFAMHVPDGFLHPAACAVTWLVALGALALGLARLRANGGTQVAPLVGIMAAGIFAGQMVNFPLFGLQASGHLMGGVLAAAVLGPWGAIVALAAVLVVQCFVFADGGVTALGANLLNMGVIGGGLGYVLYATLRRWLPGQRGAVAAGVIASWAIIPLAAAALAIEMSVGGHADFSRVATLLLFYHVLIGIGEGAVTGVVLGWIVRTRPDLLYDPASPSGRWPRFAQAATAGIVVALSVAAFLAPWASEFEDGLETVAAQVGVAERVVAGPAEFAPFPDYAPRDGTLPTSDPAGWQGWWYRAAVITAAMGVLGTVLTLLLAWLLSASARLGAARRGASYVA